MFTNQPSQSPFRLFLLSLLLTLPALSWGQLGNVWHIPGNTENGIPATMRDTLNPGPNVGITLYQGSWKGYGANQTGGTLHYRINGGSWQTAAIGYHSDVNSGTVSHNQFWKAQITTPADTGALVEYYFAPTFSNRTSPTYLFGNNAVSATQADAIATPTAFTVAFPAPVLTVNGQPSDYTKSNYYINEREDTVFPQVDISFQPNIANLTAVEIFTNLNNRDRAALDWNNDGIEDGILPPDGNNITTSDTTAYFQAHAMTDAGGGVFTLTLPVLKTGAYRLTGRYKVQGNPNWIWVGNSGHRDHAIIVAPNIARDMNMYELHVTNINAEGPTFAQRGTFEDLHDDNARVNLAWLRGMGINWIWFQPFQAQGLDGRQTDPATSALYDPGSPYSIRNFWEINPLYSSAYNGALPNSVAHPDNYAAAMAAFQGFATASDAAGVQLMLDFPFNHTAPDVVLGAKGVEIFSGAGNPGGWQAGDLIRDRVPQFFSTNGGEGPAAYSAPAQSASNIAVAPDRDDFGKWNDVRDVFFGRYATLVTGYPGADSSRATVRNKGDWFDYASMGPATINTWRYFGAVLPHWIAASGHRGNNTYEGAWDDDTRAAEDAKGIDGLRKDFGQGLPPQCMEYIINVTHSKKWNFVFMTESLDGAEVTFRSSRHFAVLNENIVFPLQAATTTSGYRGVFDDRRNAYGQSLVLLNNTSHDEVPYADPWQALIRYATVSTNDGSPMIMYGQEIGASIRVQESLPQGSWDWYELNFGKYIPNFKKWNSLQPQWTAWDANSLGIQFLRPVYAGIGQAREFSPALRSPNRWYLNRHSDNQPKNLLYAVAKYESPNTSAAKQDVVLAFTNLDRNNTQADTFRVTPELADLLGLAEGRTYNVRNIAAYLGRNGEHTGRRDAWLWGAGMSRTQIVDNGVFVSMNPVPGSDAAWSTSPYEAQFLKVYDVTPPPAPASVSAPAWSVGTALPLDFDISTYGAHDNVVSYRITVFDAGNQPIHTQGVGGYDGVTLPVNPAWYGQTVTLQTTPVSAAGIDGTAVTSDPVLLLDPVGDHDDDGMSNADEVTAGTDPTNGAEVLALDGISVPAEASMTFTTRPGRRYQLQYSEDFLQGANPPTWNNVPAPDGVLDATLSGSGQVEDPAAASSRIYRLTVSPIP